MPLYYITGNSGTGKSTVRQELKDRGYQALGVDEDGYGDWIDRTTGAIIPFPHHDANLDLHDWYRRHEWETSLPKIADLRRQADAQSEPIFLCGGASGDQKVLHLFDGIIALAVDEPTLRRRIASRHDNSFGKTPDELAIILAIQASCEAEYMRRGIPVIDAGQPIDKVVDAILLKLGQTT